MDNKTAKDHLDTVIRKARVHFYKPIQIAEILHRDRVEKDINLIKHISLTPATVEDISSSISADRIIIVCKESEKDILVSVLKQFGSVSRIQSVITEDELDEWYEKALRGQSSELIGDKILQKLANEIRVEFPSTTSEFDGFFNTRGYHHLASVDFWQV